MNIINKEIDMAGMYRVIVTNDTNTESITLKFQTDPPTEEITAAYNNYINSIQQTNNINVNEAIQEAYQNLLQNYTNEEITPIVIEILKQEGGLPSDFTY
jgi:phenylacetate-coenzyme A ligase PaaK-like adenylate-forming protein